MKWEINILEDFTKRQPPESSDTQKVETYLWCLHINGHWCRAKYDLNGTQIKVKIKEIPCIDDLDPGDLIACFQVKRKGEIHHTYYIGQKEFSVIKDAKKKSLHYLIDDKFSDAVYVPEMETIVLVSQQRLVIHDLHNGQTRFIPHCIRMNRHLRLAVMVKEITDLRNQFLVYVYSQVFPIAHLYFVKIGPITIFDSLPSMIFIPIKSGNRILHFLPFDAAATECKIKTTPRKPYPGNARKNIPVNALNAFCLSGNGQLSHLVYVESSHVSNRLQLTPKQTDCEDFSIIPQSSLVYRTFYSVIRLANHQIKRLYHNINVPRIYREKYGNIKCSPPQNFLNSLKNVASITSDVLKGRPTL